MGTSPTWQSILQQVLKIPGEQQRIAVAIGLSQMTLTRWAKGESNPQRPHLTRLVQVVQPSYRDELLEALEANYSDIHSWLKDDSAEQISSEFIAQLLSVRTTTTDALRFWRISDMVLKQVLAQLDPNQLGMAVTLVQCMPPLEKYGNKIRLMRERAGRGTFPWTADLEPIALFLGMESLAGYATESRRIVNVDDLTKEKLLPAYRTDFEVSAAAHPILLGGHIAGCLAVSSTRIGYFTQQRQTLLVAFSNLASLAFNKEEFYDPKQVELRVMPKPEYQRPILNEFRQRVSKMLTNTTYQRLRMNNTEAEHRVWLDIEEELLSLPDEAYEH
ncbi:MAG: GAF domain-containing protein [Chloroflexota bacterium]|nr:GAF domain-containing protein [Chloroflexota bacterium]